MTENATKSQYGTLVVRISRQLAHLDISINQGKINYYLQTILLQICQFNTNQCIARDELNVYITPI